MFSFQIFSLLLLHLPYDQLPKYAFSINRHTKLQLTKPKNNISRLINAYITFFLQPISFNFHCMSNVHFLICIFNQPYITFFLLTISVSFHYMSNLHFQSICFSSFIKMNSHYNLYFIFEVDRLKIETSIECHSNLSLELHKHSRYYFTVD